MRKPYGADVNWDGVVEHTLREEAERKKIWEKFQKKK